MTSLLPCVRLSEESTSTIRHRVSLGGHDVDNSVVMRRYQASLINLKKAIELCDEAYLYDNSYELTFVCAYQKGRLLISMKNPQTTWVDYLF